MGPGEVQPSRAGLLLPGWERVPTRPRGPRHIGGGSGGLSQVRGLHPMGLNNNELSHPQQPGLLHGFAASKAAQREPGFVLLHSCDLCNEVRMEELAQGSIPGKGRAAGMVKQLPCEAGTGKERMRR